MVLAFSQNSGMSFDGAYTARVSMVVLSGRVIVKKSVSLLPWLFVFVMVQPLLFLRKTMMPRDLVGLP